MPSITSIAGLMVTLLTGSHLAAAHVELQNPAPFRSKFNKFATNIDYTNTAPLDPSGSNYPCKGYHSDLGTSAGASVADYVPGQTYNIEFAPGGAVHGGGSCQISLSFDQGKSFTVIQSIIGGCPTAASYPFTIPADSQTGSAILAWSWNNKVGNREFYMNCASVTIKGGSKRAVVPVKPRAVAYSARPQIFVANLKTQACDVPEGIDVVYPQPGPDVINNGGNQKGPSGAACGAAAPGGGSGGALPPASSNKVVVPPAATSTTVVPPVAAPTIPGGVFLTVPVAEPPKSTEPPKTTLQTSTKSASPVAAPSATPGNGATGQQTVGEKCDTEGQWNCIGGKSFQRCASGQWSPVLSLAAGTSCTSGLTENLKVVASRNVRRAGKRVPVVVEVVDAIALA
jgi:hypothetical protein